MCPREYKRAVIIAATAIAVIGCSTESPSQPETKVVDKTEITTCDGAIQNIYANLDDESIEILLATEKDDLIQFHMSWGMGIRNGLGLWADDSPIRKSCAQMVGEKDVHTDTSSSIIMEGVWELVHAGT